MKPRITISLSEDGSLEIHLNQMGRDLLVRELLQLSEENDHFHLGPSERDEVQLSSRAYRTNDKIVEYGKILFRPDAWDEKYFPHVLGDPN